MFSVPSYSGEDPRQLFHNLNRGPNLRSITHAAHDDNLPASWKLSFGRVAPAPLRGDAAWFNGLTVTTFEDFERASGKLLSTQRGQLVSEHILSGVTTEDATRQAYIGQRSPFSVRRLDIVVNQQGLAVCENDEMPGGLVHAYWLDRAYGVNQRRWDRALQWLTTLGTLVFAVSSEWSAPYVQEITWFVRHLTQRGFDAAIVTSNDARRINVTWRGVRIDGKKVGTVWRQFPVFEAHGAFASLVKAAQQRKIRMVPELASWGNKAWMGMFWEQQEHFRRTMHPRTFSLLSQLLPYTRLISATSGFPSAIRSEGIIGLADFDQLLELPARYRKQVVVKMTGAHNRAARSFGVVIGTAATGTRWSETITQMLQLGGKLVMQEYRPPKRVDIPVWSVLGGTTRLENPFNGKLLIRPWAIGGQLVSATAFLTVPNTTKLHGTTTGAEIPLDFG